MLRTLPSPCPPFVLSVVPHREVVAVVVAGELDVASGRQLADEVTELRDRGFGRIELDLRGVRFIDSSGLRTLLCLRNDALRTQTALTLVPPAVEAQRVFELTRTMSLFDWRPVATSAGPATPPRATA